MGFTDEELRRYLQDGYLLKSAYLSEQEVDILRSQLKSVFEEDSLGRVMEKSGIVRSVYGSHTSNAVFNSLVRHPKLTEAAMGILRSEIYVHQFKINAKAGMGGDIWEWHQDFIFWHKKDGLPEPNLVNIAIFLDDVTEFNGPLMIIPGSHKSGMINVNSKSTLDPLAEQPAWISNVTSDLTYSLKREIVGDLIASNGIVAPKGPAGSVLLFDSNVFHGSGSNMSPFDRGVIIITYNSVNNLPKPVENARPEFLASRDYTALEPLGEDCLTMGKHQRF